MSLHITLCILSSSTADKKKWLYCSKSASQQLLVARLKTHGVRLQIEQLKFEGCTLECLPFVFHLQLSRGPRPAGWSS
jgi:hypothetical protein